MTMAKREMVVSLVHSFQALACFSPWGKQEYRGHLLLIMYLAGEHL